MRSRELEDQPQPQLNLPGGGPRAGDATGSWSQGGADKLVAAAIWTGRSKDTAGNRFGSAVWGNVGRAEEADIRCSEVGPVEQVEELGPELQRHFLGQHRVLEQREVKGGHSRTNQRVASQIAVKTGILQGEGGVVEVLVWIPALVENRVVADPRLQAGPLFAAGSVAIIVGQTAPDAQGEVAGISGGEGENSVDLPALQ